jgi:hypothetical protein
MIMKARAYVRRAALVITVCAVVASILVPSSASAGDQPPGVLPPHANSHGASYGEWAGRWWAWAWTQPYAVNPVFDRTGEFCAQGQSGSVWFLAGTFIYNLPEIVTRNCTIPVGKALFFPVYNNIWATFKGDAAFCEAAGYPSLEECALESLRLLVNPELERQAKAGGMQVIVDGKPVDLKFTDPVTSPFRVQSRAFNILLPVDNWVGITENECPIVNNLYDCYPYFGDGTYVMLAPLSAGRHTVRIVVPDLLDVTYNLTIQPKNGGNGKDTSGAAVIENAQNQLFIPLVSTQP